MLELFSNKLLFSPNEPVGTGGTKTLPDSTSREDMVEFLNDDSEPEVIKLEEDKKPTKVEKEDKEDKEDKGEGEEEKEELEEEEDELKELEEELEEPTEEQLELVTPVRRKEILKKYPNVFKDFPYLEKAYYREQQFTELLPTIEDAKNAVEAKQTLDRFENDVLSGNTELILRAVKEENPQSFNKIVDNYMNTLANVDPNAHLHVISNLTKHTIMAMVQEARRLGVGENGTGNALQSAAQILHQFIFGSSEFSPPQNLSREVKPEERQKENEISQREQQFVRQQFEFSVNDLNTRVNNSIRNTIEGNIDPNKTMTDYVRKNAIRDAEEELQSLMMKDARFVALKDKLWEKAFKEGMTRESIERINTAFRSQAKTLLPSVLKKARNNAYRGMGRRQKEEEETTKGPIKGGRPLSQSSERRTGGKVKEVPAGMSTLEFLNSD